MAIAFWCTMATVVWSQEEASPAQSLEQLLAQVKSSEGSERVSGFRTLREFWSVRLEYVRGFSDTAPGKAKSQPKPRLSEEELDSVAQAFDIGLKDSSSDVRLAAAGALAHAPRSSPAIQDAVLTGLRSEDSSVRWAVVQQKTKVWPKIELVIEQSLADLVGSDFGKRMAALELLGHYGNKTKPYSEQIVEAILQGPDSKATTSGVLLFYDLELNDAAVETLLKGAERLTDEQAGIAAFALLDHPEALKAFAEKHPSVAQSLGKGYRLFAFLCRHQYEENEVREWLSNADSLPVVIMAMLGEPRYVRQIEELEAKASDYRKKFLSACRRACGMKAEKILEVDSKHPLVFRPASAWPNTDKSRMAEDFAGHFDGSIGLMVTGEIRAADGSHPLSVQFFRMNDSMLLGESGDRPSPVKYDPATGRFVLFTDVFAAFQSGEGPYQTGSAQVRIEAPACKPLVVQFFDEIPDLRITLDQE